MIEIINQQRKVKINKAGLRHFVEFAAVRISEVDNRHFTISFISDKKMRELNGEFRGKQSTTDVLSFPFEAEEFEHANEDILENGSGFLGDIIISAEQAHKQSIENGLSLETEIRQLIVHGVLHLCGYDHETDNGEMNERETELREALNIN